MTVLLYALAGVAHWGVGLLVIGTRHRIHRVRPGRSFALDWARLGTLEAAGVGCSVVFATRNLEHGALALIATATVVAGSYSLWLLMALGVERFRATRKGE